MNEWIVQYNSKNGAHRTSAKCCSLPLYCVSVRANIVMVAKQKKNTDDGGINIKKRQIVLVNSDIATRVESCVFNVRKKRRYFLLAGRQLLYLYILEFIICTGSAQLSHLHTTTARNVSAKCDTASSIA